MCFCKAFLLERDVSHTPPGVVVRFISSERSLVASLAIIVILVGHKLVTAKSVCVREILVKLNGPSKEFQRCFVLF